MVPSRRFSIARAWESVKAFVFPRSTPAAASSPKMATASAAPSDAMRPPDTLPARSMRRPDARAAVASSTFAAGPPVRTLRVRPSSEEDDEVEKFKEFLDHVSAEDFEGPAPEGEPGDRPDLPE